jgi:hypothetical protein
MNLATKQFHIHDAIAKRLLRQQDHLLKIKFSHMPRNDAAVVRFALAGIAIGVNWLMRSNPPCNRHCELPPLSKGKNRNDVICSFELAIKAR